MDADFAAFDAAAVPQQQSVNIFLDEEEVLGFHIWVRLAAAIVQAHMVQHAIWILTAKAKIDLQHCAACSETCMCADLALVMREMRAGAKQLQAFA